MNLTTLIMLPFVAGLLTLVLGRTRLRYVEIFSVLATIASFGITLVLMSDPTNSAIGALSGLLYLDPFGMLLLFIITIVGSCTALYSVGYLHAEMKKGIIGPRRIWQYWLLFNLFIFFMLLSVTAASPMVMWAAIEATTLSTVFLVSFYSKKSSLEAGWKYLVVNSVGLLVGFFGTLTLLSALRDSVHGGMPSWPELIAVGSTMDPLTAKIAFIFILVGYGTKAGLVPMHTWLPDAHGKAPAPISALLSGVLLNTAFLAILRYKIVVDAAVGPWWAANILLAFGVLSVVVMGLMLLTQTRYKRMLAYSSIENMGIVAVSFGLGGVGVLYGLLHMLYHALVKSALFLTAGNLFLTYSSGKIRNVRGVLTTLPFTGPLLFIGLIAIVGMPPFGTFISKFGVLTTAAGAHLGVLVLLLVALALVFAGFLFHSTKMLFGTPPEVNHEGGTIHTGEYGILTVLPIVLLLSVALFLSVYIPPSLQHVLSDTALMYTPVP